jgi:hypothetical protein
MGTSGRGGQGQWAAVRSHQSEGERFLLGNSKRVPATSVLIAWEGFETSYHVCQPINFGSPRVCCRQLALNTFPDTAAMLVVSHLPAHTASSSVFDLARF